MGEGRSKSTSELTSFLPCSLPLVQVDAPLETHARGRWRGEREESEILRDEELVSFLLLFQLDLDSIELTSTLELFVRLARLVADSSCFALATSPRYRKGDADIMNNIIGRMPALDTLRLNVGTNFAPEHLEDAFAKPRPLERILVRFKPYVEKASYYQFLKGTYFDTCKLPPSHLSDLQPRR